jgi:quercetin dioxygenase-like cupin family protein
LQFLLTWGIAEKKEKNNMKDPKLYHFDQMPFEELNDKISRRYISGVNEMLVTFHLKKGAVIPEHHHVSEQITYIVKGAVMVYAGGKEYRLNAGDVLVIPPHLPHRFVALEDTIDIDVFSPIREDWLKGTDDYLKQK